MGEERHEKHLNEKKDKPKDKDEPLRSSRNVQILFWMLITLGVIITIVTNDPSTNNPLKDNTIVKTVYSSVAAILFAMAIIMLTIRRTILTDDRIRRIETKLDKILEHRDNVFQNK